MGAKRTFGFVILIIAMALLLFTVINLFFLGKSITFTNEIKLADGRVIISGDAAKQLENIFTDDLETEVPVCLAGKVEKDKIRIEKVHVTEILQSSMNNVTYVPCPVYLDGKRTIGTMHNHINGNCRLSSQDLDTYNDDISRGQTVIALFCDKYKFYVLSVLEAEIEE